MLLNTMSESQKGIGISLNNNYNYGPCSCGFYSLRTGLVLYSFYNVVDRAEFLRDKS